MNPSVILVAMLFSAILFLAIATLFILFFRIWIKAHVSGIRVSLNQLVGMRLRGSNVPILIDCYIMATKADVSVSLNQLETHALAGGDVPKVVIDLIAAHKAKTPMSFDEACAADLAGRDPVAQVMTELQAWELEFDTIYPHDDRPIEGNCLDGVPVHATIKVYYRLPVGLPNDFPVQAQLAHSVLQNIADAESLDALRASQADHEADVLRIGQAMLTTLDRVELRFEPLD